MGKMLDLVIHPMRVIYPLRHPPDPRRGQEEDDDEGQSDNGEGGSENVTSTQ